MRLNLRSNGTGIFAKIGSFFVFLEKSINFGGLQIIGDFY